MHIHKMDLGSVARKGALGLFFSSLASMAFAWSIDGYVANESEARLPGVSISSFNVAGVSAVTNAEGEFRLSSDGQTGIADFGLKEAKLAVRYQGSVLNISNKSGTNFKVSLMDALGKMAFQQEFNAPNAQIDLQKFSNQKMMILKVSSNGTSSNYVLNKDGARQVLKKDGETLPTLTFTLDGYGLTYHEMTSDEETGVKIVLKKAGPIPTSSAGVVPPASSSSNVTPVVSSSSAAVDVKPSKVLAPGNYDRTIGSRKYIIHVPSTYKGDKPVPLIVDYHPIGGNADQWAGSKTYESETQADQVIIIYPDGEASAGGFMGHAWNVGPCCNDADDVTFSRKFIEEAKKEVYIDSKRIYAVGFSMGGGMSNYAACKMADIYAAVAPASMDLSEEVVKNGMNGGCKPSRPIPVLNFRGTRDNVVSYNGGYSSVVPGKPITFLGAENNFKEWASMNQCTGSPKGSTPENGCQMYENCASGVKVGLCIDKLGGTCTGNGHEAGCARIGWAFLKQFTMP